MVTIQIVDQSYNLFDGRVFLREPLDDHIYMFLDFYGVDNFLQRSGTVLVNGNLEHRWVNIFNHSSLLFGSQIVA